MKNFIFTTVFLTISLFLGLTGCENGPSSDVVDTSFKIGTGFDNSVYKVSVFSNGKIFTSGSFGSYSGFSSDLAALLNASGSIATSFGTGSGTAYSHVRETDSTNIHVVGDFQLFNSSTANYNMHITNESASSIASTSRPGTLTDGPVYDIASQTDGKIIIVGSFTEYSSPAVTCNYIARINTNQTLDTTFNPWSGTSASTGANGAIYCVSVMTDGKILIGGDFATYRGITRYKVAMLTDLGDRDSTFNPGSGTNGIVRDIQQLSSGNILIAGSFTEYNTVSRNKIAQINSDGSLYTSFDPGTGANGTIYAAAVQSDGKILIGGSFTSYNGTPVNRLARINADGTLDTLFNTGTGADGTIRSIAFQSDGKIIIGGDFTSFDGISCNRIARILP